jgi:anti-anti-sigma factor
MSIELPEVDTRILITIDEVDHATIAEFGLQLREGLRRYAETAHPRPDRPAGSFVIDLSEVNFLGSAGIRELIDADQEAMRHGGRIVLDGAHGVVLRCLQVTGVLEHFQVQEQEGSR